MSIFPAVWFCVNEEVKLWYTLLAGKASDSGNTHERMESSTWRQFCDGAGTENSWWEI